MFIMINDNDPLLSDRMKFVGRVMGNEGNIFPGTLSMLDQLNLQLNIEHVALVKSWNRLIKWLIKKETKNHKSLIDGYTTGTVACVHLIGKL